MQLNKKTIVITGASSGIGATLAKRASLNGASVVLAARTESKLLELASDINRSGGTALAIPTDITDSEQCENLVKETIESKNSFEGYYYHIKQSIEKEKVKESLSEEELESITNLLDALNKWQEENSNATKEEYEEKRKELEDIC